MALWEGGYTTRTTLNIKIMGLIDKSTGMLNPIVGAVSGTLQGLGGSIASIINTNKTIKANKQMADYTYSKDLEMWNRQNDYNSPTSQMARLKQGGLNPNLMYSSGNVGNASSLPKYQAPRLEYNYQSPGITKGIEQYQDLSMAKASIDNIQARTRQTDQMTLNASIQQTLLNTEAQIRELKRQGMSVDLSWKDKNYAQKYDYTNYLKENVRVGTELKKSQATYTSAKTREVNRLLEIRANLIDAQYKSLLSNTALNKYRAGTMIGQMTAIKSANALRKLQGDNTQQRTDLLKKENKWYGVGKGFDIWRGWKGVQNQSINSLTGVGRMIQ
ncbi:MAG: DNA pilot protein [Microviridae sp.]|nr:MAG: DNA pilot protein [Microviridae sp.]